MRTILHMVTKNDAYRYLDCTLTHNLSFFDDAYVVDDESTDDTVEILRSHDIKYVVKPDFIPPLDEDEPGIRFFSWIAMVDACEPSTGDWIVSLNPQDLLQGDLKRALTILHAGDFSGAELRSRCLWETNPPMARTDGLWNSLSAVRIASIRPGDQAFEATHRFPNYAYGKDCHVGELPIQIINLGYLSELDKTESFDRLAQMGLNAHVKSILEPAACEPIDEVPLIWEGVQ